MQVKNPLEESEVVGITNFIDFEFELKTRYSSYYSLMRSQYGHMLDLKFLMPSLSILACKSSFSFAGDRWDLAAPLLHWNLSHGAFTFNISDNFSPVISFWWELAYCWLQWFLGWGTDSEIFVGFIKFRLNT